LLANQLLLVSKLLPRLKPDENMFNVDIHTRTLLLDK